MKKQYARIQFKQFIMSTFIVGSVAFGMSLSNSLDKEYMAKVEKHEKSIQAVADAEKRINEKSEKDLEVGMLKQK